jgi:dolichyl-phosphate beta-glucosyltransferase
LKPIISLIIPAYNEEKRLERTLPVIIDYLDQNFDRYEIIVVDDGSADKTAEKAASFSNNILVIKLQTNQGKGAAVRAGMLEAKGDFLIFSDADLSTPITELPKILEPLKKGADLAIGSRAIDQNMIKKHQPFYREFMGKTFNRIVQLLLFKGIKDTQCGFKGFSANAAKKIFSKAKVNGFSFDVEVLFLSQKMNMKIEQRPVEWFNDERSTVSPIKDSLKMLLELFRIRSLHK